MRGAIPPLPQYAFMAWCSIKKHRDNLNFLPFNPKIRSMQQIIEILKISRHQQQDKERPGQTDR
jgi:hypothetical protein